MSFRIGQRVRVAAGLVPEHQKYIGAVGTIVSQAYEKDFGSKFGTLTVQDVRWEEGASGWNGHVGHGEPVKCLAPIDDPKAFDRFMERVLKPVDLGSPVTA